MNSREKIQYVLIKIAQQYKIPKRRDKIIRSKLAKLNEQMKNN